jgi:hypothetical protein
MMMLVFVFPGASSPAKQNLAGVELTTSSGWMSMKASK